MPTIGENVNLVEKMITGNIGCKHTIALSAKAASPHLVKNLGGVKLGDHVLTFVATINLVVY